MGGTSGAALALAAMLAAVFGGMRLIEYRLRNSDSGRGERVQGARWARGRDLAELRLRQHERGRVVLGYHRGRLLASRERSSVLVVGPTTTSLKTTGLTIPAVLEWDGPVVATSVKSGLLLATLAKRRELGKAMVFDPIGTTGLGTVKATPLSGCGTWHGAKKAAHVLSRSSRSGSDGLQDSAFWHAAAEKLLEPLLFAAASSGGEMADVIRWLNDGSAAEEEVQELLEAAGCEEAVGAWRANWNREERQRSSIYTTAETVLRAFSDPRVLGATSRADYTPAKLLDGGANTLYLCSPAHEQERLRSLYAAMLSELVGAVYETAARTEKPIDPPLLLVLDEAANAAPMPDLDVVASTGAGQGIQLVSVFQDFSQAQVHWGKRAYSIFNNHSAKVFASGIADPPTLNYIEAVVGDGEFRQRSETAGEGGRGSATEGNTYRRLTPANVIREAKQGTALLVAENRPVAQIALRPWFGDSELTAMVEGRQP